MSELIEKTDNVLIFEEIKQNSLTIKRNDDDTFVVSTYNSINLTREHMNEIVEWLK